MPLTNQKWSISQTKMILITCWIQKLSINFLRYHAKQSINSRNSFKKLFSWNLYIRVRPNFKMMPVFDKNLSLDYLTWQRKYHYIIWDEIIPKMTNFSNVIVMLCLPMFCLVTYFAAKKSKKERRKVIIIAITIKESRPGCPQSVALHLVAWCYHFFHKDNNCVY